MFLSAFILKRHRCEMSAIDLVRKELVRSFVRSFDRSFVRSLRTLAFSLVSGYVEYGFDRFSSRVSRQSVADGEFPSASALPVSW